MRGIALVIEAVNVVLRHLGEIPEGPEASALRDEGLGYINEALLWKEAQPRPSVETRNALMKKVLALHVAVRKLSRGEGSQAR